MVPSRCHSLRGTAVQRQLGVRVGEIRFTLFVAGDTPRSHLAIANLRRLANGRLAGRCSMRVVDVQKDPELAEAERILTTPTLIKESPMPARRVTGDLSDLELVLFALSLSTDE